MTPKQCKDYVRKVVKVKRWENNHYSIMIGAWAIQDIEDRDSANHEAYRLRQAILETIMVDLVLDKSKIRKQLGKKQ